MTDPRRWLGLAVLSLSLFTITSDMTILNVAIPEMAAELQPTSSQQLWIIDAYSLAMAGLLISMSSLADRYGRRRFLMLGYSIVALASALVFFADTAEIVIGLRILLGVGAAMIMPSTLSLLRVTFTDVRERAMALAIWAATASLGTAVGPLLGGFLLEHFSWHAAFLVSVPLMLIALVGAGFALPESTARHPGRWDYKAAWLSIIGMTAAVWGIKAFGKEASLLVGPAWAALALAIVLLTWFAVRCKYSANPLMDISLFSHRIFSAGFLSALIANFSMAAGLLLLAQWLQLVNGASAMEAGVQLLPMAIAAALASLAAPALAGRMGLRGATFIGLFVSGLGFVYLGVLGAEWFGTQLTVPAIAASLTLAGIGIGVLIGVASSMIMGGVPLAKAGSAAAMEDTAYEIGAVLGVSLLGSLAALLYRADLLELLDGSAIGPEAVAAAQESLGGAVAVAQEMGIPQLAEYAGQAFSSGFGVSGLVGGGIMMVFAFVVFRLTPRGTQLEDLEH